jgi:hypothetical protein
MFVFKQPSSRAIKDSDSHPRVTPNRNLSHETRSTYGLDCEPAGHEVIWIRLRVVVRRTTRETMVPNQAKNPPPKRVPRLRIRQALFDRALLDGGFPAEYVGPSIPATNDGVHTQFNIRKLAKSVDCHNKQADKAGSHFE